MKKHLLKSLLALALVLISGNAWGTYVELYSATFTEVGNHSYTQNKAFTLNEKDWTASVSQLNSGVFYLGCNSTNAAKGILNDNTTFSAVVTALCAEDDSYNDNKTTAHAYALLFNNAYNDVTKVVFDWVGGNSSFYVYLFGDSGSGYQLLQTTDYDDSGATVAGSVEWTGAATNYSKFAIVARPYTTQGVTTNKTLRASTFKIYKTQDASTVITPTFSLPTGEYYGTQNVTISCLTEGATIYYTTDGTAPTTSSNVYSAAIPVSATTTIKALGAKEGSTNSEIATATYTIKPVVTGYTVDFELNDLNSYPDWTFTNAEIGTSAITAHGGTYYATTGGKATASFQTKEKYANPGDFTCYVSKTTTNTTTSTWKVQVSSDGTTWTDVATQDAASMSKGTWITFTADLSSYTNVYVRLYYSGSTAVRTVDDISLTEKQAVATPTFSLAEGTYTAAQSVTIACTTEGANIYYTIDGTDPTASSTHYSSAIAVSSTTTIKAIAVKGAESSLVASATFTILPVVHAGTEADPYTIADARNAIDANIGVTGVYVKGIVSEIVTPYNSEYGNISYNLSEDGTTTAVQLQAYRGKGVGGAQFTSANDIIAGDVVVVSGNLTKYGETYEFAQDNQLAAMISHICKVSAYQWATASFSYPVVVPAANTVYAVTGVEGSTLTLGALAAGTVIAAGDGVLVYKETEGNVEFAYTNQPADGFTTILRTSGAVSTSDYILGTYDGGFGFCHPSAEITCTPGKAFLPGSFVTTSTPAPFLRIGGTTHVDNLERNAEDAVYFDLLGRKVAQPERGIYILNGKKVLVQ